MAASFHHLHGLVGAAVSLETLGLLWNAGVPWPPSKAVWKLLVGLNYSYSSGDTASLEAFTDLTLEPR